MPPVNSRSDFQGSPFNPPDTLPEPARQVLLHDVTLREGEQAAPVAFSLDDRVVIAQALDRIGVRRIQVGFAGRDDDAIHAVKNTDVQAEISVLCVVFDDMWRHNIEAAAQAGADVVLLLLRASDEQLALAGLTRDEGLRRITNAIEHARGQVSTVVFQPSFATTAEPDYLVELCATAAAAGCHEIAVADTVGVATPEGTARLVSAVREAADVPVGVHLHDDYGLALANSVAALHAGATIIEVSVLGLGERAGNCALEEMTTVLEGLYGVDTNLDIAQLNGLARTVAEHSGVPVPTWKSIVGEDVFTQKLDIHVKVTSQAPWLLEPFDPLLVGQHRTLKLGRGSGPHAVRAKLDSLGQKASAQLTTALVAFVNRRAVEQKGVVTDEQLLSELERLRATA